MIRVRWLTRHGRVAVLRQACKYAVRAVGKTGTLTEATKLMHNEVRRRFGRPPK